ncbi:DEAD/DEAH box helicase family protein [Vibrio alfacsensis]|uniref:DEAD/DEAH box helicase family protein n=1 Tax=Vibrio alfacsensis TaxID=1074311 RepID=UPI0040694BD8
MSNFTLKKYQKNALSVISDFLVDCRETGDIPSAYKRSLIKQKQGSDNFTPAPYREYSFESVPYFCIRIPTGGGKTILGTYTVTTASKAYLEKDYPIALWLVPTITIQKQTVDALRSNPNYRQHLDSCFKNDVIILDIDDVHQIRPQDIGNKAIIVVSTLANPRVSKTNERKIYSYHEDFEPHFAKITPAHPEYNKLDVITDKDLKKKSGLTEDDLGKVKCSFINILTLCNPIIIVDEAHNARTELTLKSLQRVNPAAIIEFTATPNTTTTNGSNVLFHVSASELKNEEMIKLPIMLTEHTNGWEEAVQDAILTRNRLEICANKEQAHTGQYIRPIVLFQAENKDGDVTVDVLANHLQEEHNIDVENEVAIVTGNQRQLDGIDLFSPECCIKYVITIEALKEGWDCSFAYVFCSVKSNNSTTAAEQLLGRVLRMPYAKNRVMSELNRAYAHLATPTFAAAAAQMKDQLISMGFEQMEVDSYLRQMDGQGSLFGNENEENSGNTAAKKNTKQPQAPTFRTEIKGEFDSSGLSDQDKRSVEIETSKDGRTVAKVVGKVTPTVKKAIQKVSVATAQEIDEQANSHNKSVQAALSPSQRGIAFKSMPQLCIMFEDELEVAENEAMFDAHNWSILDYDDTLDFQINETTKTFSVGINNGNKVTYKTADKNESMNLNLASTEVTEDDLVKFIDGEVRQSDVLQSHMRQFIKLIVKNILQSPNMTLTTLVRHKYPLCKAILSLIGSIREQARKDGYQQTLFADDAQVETSYDLPFDFLPDHDPARPPFYSGRYEFQKHYYPNIEDLKEVPPQQKDHEFHCAQYIDMMQEVKHWVRNPVDRSSAFRLPKPDGRYFYPDFIAELKDGRFLVVEYKGEGYKTTDDSKVKEDIGKLWASKHPDCIFVLVSLKDKKNQSIDQQIQKALNSK